MWSICENVQLDLTPGLGEAVRQTVGIDYRNYWVIARVHYESWWCTGICLHIWLHSIVKLLFLGWIKRCLVCDNGSALRVCRNWTIPNDSKVKFWRQLRRPRGPALWVAREKRRRKMPSGRKPTDTDAGPISPNQLSTPFLDQYQRAASVVHWGLRERLSIWEAMDKNKSMEAETGEPIRDSKTLPSHHELHIAAPSQDKNATRL